MSNSESAERDSKHRVWACSHLWERFMDGDDEAAWRIGGTAIDFLFGVDENVTVCGVCERAEVVPMELHRVRLDDEDNAIPPEMQETAAHPKKGGGGKERGGL